TYSSVSEYLIQLERFSTLAAEDYLARGKQSGVFRLVLSPPAVFLKNYILKAGFLDGRAGFVVSCLSAVSTFFKLLKTEELRGSNQ
ncbi:MAG: glycosyltransferase family 2 protein, partial [Acidobacteriota bacterium]